LGRFLYATPHRLDASTPLASSPFHEQTYAASTAVTLLKQVAASCRERRFSYLNLPDLNLGNPVDWTAAPEENRLWQYNLHYGEWALQLGQAATSTQDATGTSLLLIELLEDWIDNNPPGSTPGWEPYPLCRRLVLWSRLPFLLPQEPRWQRFWSRTLEPSLRLQARFLRRNLEHDVPNNHLLANFRALAWVGMFFPSWPESKQLAQFGLDGLWSQARRQVLADGVHDERSISYHTIVLQDLLETWLLARSREVSVPSDIEPLLHGMFEFLAATRTPNGTWPMLNDTVPGYPIDPEQVLAAGAALFSRPELISHTENPSRSTYRDWLVGPLATTHGGSSPTPLDSKIFQDAGYAVLRDEHTYLLFDAGPMGPARLPGHGHADSLSFELHTGNVGLIVDPGVFTYAAGRWRNHFRATASHNTVAVDEQDQCVFWGAFRVAFPPASELTSWSEDHVEGQHDGYCRFSDAVLHRRRISRIGPGTFEILDIFEGSGDHRFDLNLQFSPTAQATTCSLGATVHWPGETRLEIKPVEPSSSASSRIEDGWISAGWHRKERAPRYVLSWRGKAPLENRLIIELNSQKSGQ
jgi:hypothetical protein